MILHPLYGQKYSINIFLLVNVLNAQHLNHQSEYK